MKHSLLLVLTLVLLAACLRGPPPEYPRPDISGMVIHKGAKAAKAAYPERARHYPGQKPEILASQVRETLEREGFSVTTFEPRLGIVVASRDTEKKSYRSIFGGETSSLDEAYVLARTEEGVWVFAAPDNEKLALSFFLQKRDRGTDLLIDGIFWDSERRKDMFLRTVVHEVPKPVPVEEVAEMFSRLKREPGFEQAAPVKPLGAAHRPGEKILFAGLTQAEDVLSFTLPEETPVGAAVMMLDFIHQSGLSVETLRALPAKGPVAETVFAASRAILGEVLSVVVDIKPGAEGGAFVELVISGQVDENGKDNLRWLLIDYFNRATS